MKNNFLFKKIRYAYYNVQHGFKNLFEYFFIIWNDRNFDYAYLYYILHKKLENMEKFFNSDQISVSDAKNTAQEIRNVKDCIERLIQNNYLEYLNEYFIEKKDHKYCNENFKNLYDYADLYRNCDKKFVFSSMQKNIEKWWD